MDKSKIKKNNSEKYRTTIGYKLRQLIPESMKKKLRPVIGLFTTKNSSELSFWINRLRIDQGKFNNSDYESLMLAMAERQNQNFLKDKVVADFGCGPRGSLAWASLAHTRIGIDVLADKYTEKFKANTLLHGMIYLKSSENHIPLPNNYIDVLFTLNAMDHVNNFEEMSAEVIRILKPGGEFIGSFNLEEPYSVCEPLKLNEKIIAESILKHLEVISYRITLKGKRENIYEPFFSKLIPYERGKEGLLWIRARKPL